VYPTFEKYQKKHLPIRELYYCVKDYSISSKKDKKKMKKNFLPYKYIKYQLQTIQCQCNHGIKPRKHRIFRTADARK